MKGLFIKWMLTWLALGLIIACVFFPQIRAVAGSWLDGNEAGEAVLTDADLAGIRGVKFLPPGENIVKVSVSNLHVIDHGAGYATVSISLTSSQPTSRYPNLRIFLQTAGQTVRTVVIPPTDYQHQAMLTSEQVQVTLTLHSGETGFTAAAFYSDSGA